VIGGDTPCFYAVALADEAGIQYMELMLEYGADLSLQNDEGNTVLDEAVKCGKDKTALYLIEKGAVPTENTVKMLFDGYVDSRNGRCAYAMLHSLLSDYGLTYHEIPAAIRVAVLGEEPTSEELEELSEDNQAWLRWCTAAFGRPETMEKLCTSVSLDEILDAEGQSLMEIAAQTGNRNMLVYLLGNTDYEPFLWRSLVRAVEYHQTECVSVLLEYIEPKCMQALSRPEWEIEWLWRKALIHDDPALLALLYDEGLVPLESSEGESIGNCLRDSIEGGKEEALKFLLNHFDVSPGDYLDTASRYKNVEATQILVNCGVAKEDADYALPHAAAGGSTEIVRLLLDLGANPNIEEPTYGSPLLAAARFGNLEVVKMLLEKGADTRQIYWDESDNILIEVAFGSSRVFRCLIEAGADVNYRNKNGETPLFYAVVNNRPENVSLLIEADSAGNTAFHLAEEKGYEEIITILKEHDAI